MTANNDQAVNYCHTNMIAGARIIDQIVNSAAEHNRTELDLHADTCSAGRNSIVISQSGRLMNVSPFSDTYDKTKSAEVLQA
jgi:hypothetical protein